MRRSPHGERGLKCNIHCTALCLESRSPHGERGLKSLISVVGLKVNEVAPPTGSVD